VHNLFVFDNLVSYIFFVMLLGFIDALSASRDADDAVLAQEDTRPLIAEPSVRATVAGVGVAVVCVFGYLTTIPHINASLSLINALRNAGTVQSALKQQPAAVPQLTANAEQYFTAALDDDIGADEARMQLSNVAATFSNLSVATDTQNSFLSRAETELKDMADNDPLNTRATYLYATFEARFGHLQTAQALFKKLLDINPNRQLFLNEYGLAQELSGDLSGGNETFARLAELGPKNQEYVSRYAASLFALHKNADAYVVIATAFGTSTADAVNLSAQRGKTQTFSDANTVIQFEITHAQLIDGGDIQAYIQTIITLANAGHASEALLLIDEAAKLNPDFAAQAPSLKTAIQTGKNLVWTGGQ
jgi:tetratricopeptide (TPR) repeat protein